MSTPPDEEAPAAPGAEEAPAAPGAAPPPPERPLDPGAHPAYPDDGELARTVRQIDTWIGRVEQVVLVALLAIVVLTAASHALLDRLADTSIPFKDEVIRAGTFALAMLGAAFASHQARHLSMDLISRRLSPRGRLLLKLLLTLFTIAIVALFVRSGFHLIDKERELKDEHLLSSVVIAHLIPIGGGLIILHCALHAILDLDYLVRRKTPPERMRSAH